MEIPASTKKGEHWRKKGTDPIKTEPQHVGGESGLRKDIVCKVKKIRKRKGKPVKSAHRNSKYSKRFPRNESRFGRKGGMKGEGW